MTILTFVIMVTDYSKLGDIINFLQGVLGTLAVYAYINKKRFSVPELWLSFFWLFAFYNMCVLVFILVGDTSSFLFNGVFGTPTLMEKAISFFLFLSGLPALYAMSRLAGSTFRFRRPVQKRSLL